MGDFVLVGTWPFSDKAVSHTAKLLSANENLVTALVAGVNAVEEDPLLGPYFVGKGGMPNAEGVYELDAAVMRGSDLRVGAVGALQNIVRPAAVALQVLLHSPHSFLCGQGAQKFAIDHGILYESVGTPESDAAFQVDNVCGCCWCRCVLLVFLTISLMVGPGSSSAGGKEARHDWCGGLARRAGGSGDINLGDGL
eukprot:m.125921 g.125921  ORF g.125921 m.125921 type:complete len:196 (-) comp14682_c0_seq3:521-1108(-)